MRLMTRVMAGAPLHSTLGYSHRICARHPGGSTQRLGESMLYLLWGVVCAVALFALLLVWTVGAAAWDGVVRTRQRPVEGGSMIQRLVTWAVLCLVFVPTVAATGVFLLAAFFWTARRLWP
jgi:hypothetical protein